MTYPINLPLPSRSIALSVKDKEAEDEDSEGEVDTASGAIGWGRGTLISGRNGRSLFWRDRRRLVVHVWLTKT